MPPPPGGMPRPGMPAPGPIGKQAHVRQQLGQTRGACMHWAPAVLTLHARTAQLHVPLHSTVATSTALTYCGRRHAARRRAATHAEYGRSAQRHAPPGHAWGHAWSAAGIPTAAAAAAAAVWPAAALGRAAGQPAAAVPAATGTPAARRPGNGRTYATAGTARRAAAIRAAIAAAPAAGRRPAAPWHAGHASTNGCAAPAIRRLWRATRAARAPWRRHAWPPQRCVWRAAAAWPPYARLWRATAPGHAGRHAGRHAAHAWCAAAWHAGGHGWQRPALHGRAAAAGCGPAAARHARHAGDAAEPGHAGCRHATWLRRPPRPAGAI